MALFIIYADLKAGLNIGPAHSAPLVLNSPNYKSYAGIIDHSIFTFPVGWLPKFTTASQHWS